VVILVSLLDAQVVDAILALVPLQHKHAARKCYVAR
jgi:hypothetical protein